jgi:hypothetical protein
VLTHPPAVTEDAHRKHSGIGLSLVKQSQQLGSKIVIGDLKLGEEAAALVAKDENIIFQPCDVTKWGDLEALVAASEKKWGDAPDAYGICAGVFDPVRMLQYVPSEDADSFSYRLGRISGTIRRAKDMRPLTSTSTTPSNSHVLRYERR